MRPRNKKSSLDGKATIFLQSLGKSIRCLRLERKITRNRLGHQLGLSVFKIDLLEQGRLDIDVLQISKILGTFRVSSTVLFREAECLSSSPFL